MNTGERILHELEKRDIPKNVLATAIGVSATTIGKWDVNNDIKFQNIIKTSKYLNVSLDYLAYGKENTKLSDVENEMLENFRQLPPNEQQQFIGRCKEILDRISSENRKNIQDLVDQKANLNNAEIETLKEVLTGTLNHIKTLDEKISSMESIINSLQDVIDTLTNMLQND